MSVPHYWTKGKRELSKKDPVIKLLITQFNKENLKIKNSPYKTLINSIIGQQISVKAADSVRKKFYTQYKPISPANIAGINIRTLQKAGLSKQKTQYIKNISNYFLDTKSTARKFSNMSDQEIINELTTIKGVGVWTAEMFLIFALGRPNVLPVQDLGLIKAISLSYKKGKKVSATDLKKLSNKWSPYSTIATWYLWRSLDPGPVNY
jgi:DNA-3-methyladenine glycosylase II